MVHEEKESLTPADRSVENLLGLMQIEGAKLARKYQTAFSLPDSSEGKVRRLSTAPIQKASKD